MLELEKDRKDLSPDEFENKYPQVAGENGENPNPDKPSPAKLGPCPCGSKKKYRDCCRIKDLEIAKKTAARRFIW